MDFITVGFVVRLVIMVIFAFVMVVYNIYSPSLYYNYKNERQSMKLSTMFKIFAQKSPLKISMVIGFTVVAAVFLGIGAIYGQWMRLFDAIIFFTLAFLFYINILNAYLKNRL